MAKALGVTMCLLSVCGEASNTRRCTCGLMRASVKPATPLDAISISTIPSVHIRALTARRPIRPTSPCCRSARRPNPGRGSTHRRGNSVQRIGTTALEGKTDMTSVFRDTVSAVCSTNGSPASCVQRALASDARVFLLEFGWENCAVKYMKINSDRMRREQMRDQLEKQFRRSFDVRTGKCTPQGF